MTAKDHTKATFIRRQPIYDRALNVFGYELLYRDNGLNAANFADGDLATLMARIAHVRTWTYVSHRPDWLEDAGHWQERARAIEDRLSDALHERLMQRFVDRRAAALSRLRGRDDIAAQGGSDGGVWV